MNWLAKLSWFLYNSTNMTTVVITIIYWVVLFESGSTLEAMNFFVHAFNSIASIGDLLLAKRPCRLMHFYHPLLIFLAYTAFSAIYWAAGGRNEDGLSYIYPVLDWENLGLTIPFVSIGLVIALPIAHFFIWALHLLRDWCCKTLSLKIKTNVQSGIELSNPTFTQEENL